MFGSSLALAEHNSLIYTLRSTAKIPCAQPFCSSVVLSWPGSQFSKPRPVTISLLLSLTLTTYELNSPRPTVRDELPPIHPSLSPTPVLLATFSSPFLLSLELLKEVEGEEHGHDPLQLRV